MDVITRGRKLDGPCYRCPGCGDGYPLPQTRHLQESRYEEDEYVYVQATIRMLMCPTCGGVWTNTLGLWWSDQ